MAITRAKNPPSEGAMYQKASMLCNMFHVEHKLSIGEFPGNMFHVEQIPNAPYFGCPARTNLPFEDGMRIGASQFQDVFPINLRVSSSPSRRPNFPEDFSFSWLHERSFS